MTRWVSLSEASRILKTPETTLRRMAVEGKIMAEREPRAPGDPRTVWRIRVDDPPDDPPLDPPSSATPEPEHPPPIRQEPSAALSAITDALAAERARADRLIAENGALHERAASAEAERDLLHERLLDLERQRAAYVAWLDEARAEVERLKARAAMPWWKRLW